MNAIKKALLPSGIAIAFLLFLGAVGSTPTTSADMVTEGLVCGDDYVAVGQARAYWIVMDDDSEDDNIGAEVNGPGSIVGKLDGNTFNDIEVAATDEIGGLDVVEVADLTGGALFGLGLLGIYDCDDEEADGRHVSLVIVECDAIGEYTVSFFSDSSDDHNGSLVVTCVGVPDDATLTAMPTTVEIAPSYANVAHSLITLTLIDEEEEAAYIGDNVVFYTDRCAIETSAVNSGEEYNSTRTLFNALNALVPSTAEAIEESDAANTAPDSNRTQDEALTFERSNGDTIAAAVLHCDPIHAPGVTPGVAKITAIVDVEDPDGGDNDLIRTVTVTVVGPPAPNGVTVTASPATLICGEKATIVVDVKDSIGQPVSDHTLVEAVTNTGGVLAGNGAVAGYAGPVVPVSSTVAETFGGKATIYLLTSTVHVGKYEVVVTTGGGGGVTGHLGNGTNYTNYLGGLFTTAPISVQVTVECTVPAPAPAPTTTGPSTGTGIKPPSTGDAGLASSSSSSSLTLIAGAVVAAATLGLVVKKVAADKIS